MSRSTRPKLPRKSSAIMEDVSQADWEKDHQEARKAFEQAKERLEEVEARNPSPAPGSGEQTSGE